MTTLGELRLQILRLLGNPDGEGYSDDLLFDAIGMAFDAILPWTPKTSKVGFTGDGTKTSFALPVDLYEVEAVITDLGEVLPKAYLQTGQKIGTYSINANDWLLYPNGYITFSRAISSEVVFTLYYLAHWTKPTTGTDLTTIIEIPERSLIGICLYSAAYAIFPEAIGASEVRQFGTRVDSGNPEHNPMQRTALYLLDLFHREMSRHPKHQKAAS